jgi:hypothetical protein
MYVYYVKSWALVHNRIPWKCRLEIIFCFFLPSVSFLPLSSRVEAKSKGKEEDDEKPRLRRTFIAQESSVIRPLDGAINHRTNWKLWRPPTDTLIASHGFPFAGTAVMKMHNWNV